MDRNESAYHIHQNVLAWRGCERLYLDERTADVHSVFPSSDHHGTIKKISAHRAILSASSPVFDALLYGPFSQYGDIQIEGTTIQAFREFLQFFYICHVKITTKNVAAVMELAKRYAVADCINACADFCQTTLTIDNVCVGYELAIQFELETLRQKCEQKICENAAETFKTHAFLHCKPNLLRAILQLDGFQCEDTMIFDGCIEWAKNACIENHLDETNGKNIRQQLGDLFHATRFTGMTVKEFHKRSKKHVGLFSLDEYHDIIGQIAENDPKSTSKLSPTTGQRLETSTLSCSRIDLALSAAMNQHVLPPIDVTVFSSNCALKLAKIYCSEIFCADEPLKSIPFGIKIVEMDTQQPGANGNVLYFRQMLLNPNVTTAIEFPTPITIRADQNYGIVLQFQKWNSRCYNLLVHKARVELNDEISIMFYNCPNDFAYDCQRFGLITQMDFVTHADRRK